MLGKGTYTAEGITAIADALRVSGVLTEVRGLFFAFPTPRPPHMARPSAMLLRLV